MRFRLIGTSEMAEDGFGQSCEVAFQAESWPEVLPKLKDFLQGCGYCFEDGFFEYVTDAELDKAMRCAGCCTCGGDA